VSGEGWLRGDWMQLRSGRRFYPLDPQPEDIDPGDIAHALSMLCRYGGHVERFYSVAEHCVMMSRVVPPEDALAALLHDATEAFVVDVPRPLKRYLPEYRAIESEVWAAISTRFGVSPELPDSVHDADTRILVNEVAAFMPNAEAWENLKDLRPLPITVQGWSPEMAERQYRRRLQQLGVEL
jgi:hypothetical protein